MNEYFIVAITRDDDGHRAYAGSLAGAGDILDGPVVFLHAVPAPKAVPA